MALEAGPDSDQASESRPKVTLRTAMLTDVGVVRDHNEDAAFVDEQHEFFIVADGMGGHAAGEIASEMAVETVSDALRNAHDQIDGFARKPTEEGRKAIVALLEQAVRDAHQAVFDRGARETDKQGMGTTLDVVLLAGAEAFVAHVGDSRTYLLRDGKAAQVTTDHTVAEVLVIEGKLSLEEAQISPLRTILVNAIGVAPDVGVEMAHIQLRKGDDLLLCSDGLHDYFPVEHELVDRLTDAEPEDALQTLTELAKERGGHDNITGVVVRVLDVDPPPEDVPSDVPPEVSDGIPATVDKDDTLPVDVGEEAPPEPPTSTSAEARGKDKQGRPQADTEPMPTIAPPAGDEDTAEMNAPDGTEDTLEVPLDTFRSKATDDDDGKGQDDDGRGQDDDGKGQDDDGKGQDDDGKGQDDDGKSQDDDDDGTRSD